MAGYLDPLWAFEDDEHEAEVTAFNALTHGQKALAYLFVGKVREAQVYATLALVVATNKAARR